MLVGYELTNKVDELDEQLIVLDELVTRHEDRRRQVSVLRGFECGHTGEAYPRECCKAAVKRQIVEIRKTLMELSRLLDRKPGVWGE